MSELAVLDEADLPWIADVVDELVELAGQPWRVALERIGCGDVPPRQLAAVLGALRRLLGGSGRHATLARRARGLVLGAPALDAAARAARLASAAVQLELAPAEMEAALWADLPGERPIELRGERPSELELAAFGNVELIQRAVARAHAVVLRIRGNAGPLIRAAALRGLLATARRDGPRAVLLEIVGPLALVHRTAVYGRALAGLVPLLATCDGWELAVQATHDGQVVARELASPVLLPVSVRPPASEHVLATRLAHRLGKLAPELALTRAPLPIVTGSTLLTPELVLAGHPLEVIGFWTAPYLEAKVARYRAAGTATPILCIDAARGCADEEPPEGARIVWFRRRIDAREVLACVR